jgi:hypothetical protein
VARGIFGFFVDKLPPLVKGMSFTGVRVEMEVSTSLEEGETRHTFVR